MLKKSWPLIFFFFFVFSLAAQADFVPGQVMVKFKPGVVSIPQGMRASSIQAASIRAASVSALNTKHGVYRIEQLYAKVLEIKPEWTDELGDQYILIFPEEEDVEGVARDYKNNSNIESADPVSIVHAFATNPDDPRFVSGDQYGLNNINAPLAWDRTTGSTGITIAVMDTGLDYNHEDMQGRVNLADAYDFVNNDTDPMDDHTNSHGSSVAGVIGATTNNAIGVAGVDWQAKILPIKVLDNNGDGSMSDILQGLAWARAKGADVVNMSFGQYTADSSLRQACLSAYNDGLVLVAAAGNGNVDWPTYPAYYPTVIAVAAVDSSDQRSVWSWTDPITGQTQASNYGTWVDVCAPGTLIWSIARNDNYSTSSGTSLACPFVSGLAGLIKAANPAYTNQEIMEKISSEADNIDSLNPGYVGKLGGRINAYLAVAGAVANISSPADGAYVAGTVAVTGSAGGWDFQSYRLEALQGSSLVATIETSTASVESGVLGSWNTAGINGQYIIRLQVESVSSNTEESQVSVYVDNSTPEATIYYPADGASIAGTLTILGTAEDQYIDHFVLDYGQGASPASFVTIKTAYSSVSGGILGTWETAGLNGQYAVRLRVYDKVGNVVTKTVTLTLQNSGPVAKEAEPQPGFPIVYTSENPFDKSETSEITFIYTLAGNFDTKIYLFDLSGNLVWQKSYSTGENGGKSGVNNPSWTGQDSNGAYVSNGVYLYQVVADGRPLARGKLIILN
ncbi:MAG: S8 family serine peptidase [Candidatus Margulisbacteria bacterium]|nr:S8 family serine peptidase [Candidatus Margulisiibacteriota bacterium]